MKRITALAVASSLFAAVACMDTELTSGKAATAERPSILLITLDTTRADSIGPDAGGIETPSFNQIAARGRRFIQAYATVPETLPSHISMMTGLYPGGHGVHENARYLDDSTPVLAEILQERGYRTAAFISAFPLSRQFGLARGFQHYDDHLQGAPERRAKETAARAVDWLRKQKGEELFVWVHFFDPHDPYEPPAPFDQDYRDAPYLGEIAAMDEQIGRLITEFEATTAGSAAIAIVGDHGEGLGEHGEQLHGHLVYQSTMLVPLLIAGPGVDPGVSDVPVSNRRIFDTVLGWAGKDMTSSLLQEVEEIVLGEAMKPHLQYGWQPQIMAVDGPLKAIHAGDIEIYDVRTDPAEQHDRSSEIEPSREMRRAIQDYPVPSLALDRAPSALSDEDRRQLASLGYVSSDTRPVIRPDAPRPVEMTHLFETMDDASRLFVESDYRSAIPLLEEILESDPHNLTSALRLAAAHSALGNSEQAMAAFRRAREIAPKSVDVEHYLGLHHLRRGDWRSAAPLIERVLDKEPARITALEALSEIRERQDRPDEALALLNRVLQQKAASQQDLLRKGRLAMELGRTPVAIEAFERLRKMSGESFRHDLELGVLYLNARRFGDARRALDRALASDPHHPMTLFKRAQTSVLLGEPDSSVRIERAKTHADEVTRSLIEREPLFR